MPPLPFTLRSSLIAIGLALLALLLVVQTVRIEGLGIWPLHITGLKAQVAHEKAERANVQRTFDETVRNYRAAAEQARLKDAANVARIKAEQAHINERTARDYQARLADARARAERLRSRLEAGANPGDPGTAPMPRTERTPGGPDAAPPEDGFSIRDRLIATEQAIQLDELQRWIKRNLTLDWSGSSPSSPSASLSPKTKPVPSGRQPTASPISERS